MSAAAAADDRAAVAGYTAAEVAQILGVTEARVRAFVRSGLLSPARGPRGEHRFTMQDLVVLRTARSLSQKLSPGRVQRALRQVRAQVPDRPLAGLQIGLFGSDLVVREGEALWQPGSGQQVLDFEARPPSAPLARMPERTPPAVLNADQWYERGCDVEADDPPAAREAYERALAADPTHAGARINLGRLLQEEGRRDEAVAHYRAVLAREPGHALAAFNLGVALEDEGRADEARAAYEQAVASDPRLGDAHYNLSRLHERAGRLAEAIRHLKAYRELTAGSR